MQESHEFDMSSTSAFSKLTVLLETRFALGTAVAASQQAEFEVGLREAMTALERDIHAADLSRLDVDDEGLIVDGERFRRLSKKTRGIVHTISGPVEIERSVYRARGGHGGKTICPLEMRLGLVDGRWTSSAAEMACRYMAATTSKESAELIALAGGMKPSPAHLDRLPKAVSAAWENNREKFEAAVRESEVTRLPSPALVSLIFLSLDGVMVPMKDAPRTPGVGKQGTGPKGHKEAACGTLALFDEKGERLHTIRFARMPESKKVTLQAQLNAELETLVERYPEAKITAVADGAEENWRIIGEISQKVGKEISPTLDYYHAAEHIDEVLRRHAGADQERSRADMKYWHEVLRDEKNGARRVLCALKYRAEKATGDAKTEMLKHCRYIEKRKHMMNYAALCQQGEPIGSGIQEAACKTLVSQRMKNSGMSWRHPGGQAILTLRSQNQSGRSADAWSVLRPAFTKNYIVDKDNQRLKPLRPLSS